MLWGVVDSFDLARPLSWLAHGYLETVLRKLLTLLWTQWEGSLQTADIPLLPTWSPQMEVRQE